MGFNRIFREQPKTLARFLKTGMKLDGIFRAQGKTFVPFF